MISSRTESYIKQLHDFTKEITETYPKGTSLTVQSQKTIAQYAILIMRDSKKWFSEPFSGLWLDQSPLAYNPIVISTGLKGCTPDARSQESYFDNIKMLGTEALKLFLSDISDGELVESKEIQSVLNNEALRLNFYYCGIIHSHYQDRSSAEFWRDDYTRFKNKWKKEVEEAKKSERTGQYKNMVSVGSLISSFSKVQTNPEFAVKEEEHTRSFTP